MVQIDFDNFNKDEKNLKEYIVYLWWGGKNPWASHIKVAKYDSLSDNGLMQISAQI